MDSYGLMGSLYNITLHLNIMKSSLAFCLDFFINAFGFRPKTHVWFEAGKHLYTSVTVDSTSKMYFGTVQKIN